VTNSIFNLQRQIAEHLINLLENREITIKRAAEIAKQVINIIPEDFPDSTLITNNVDAVLAKIKQELQVIPELKSLIL
jgi:hypothetical protein